MNSEVGAKPRVAVTMDGRTRFGFLLSEDAERGIARVRFLGPRGSSVADVPKSDILGIVGKNFSSSLPSRPDICERVIFFDHGRQRKGWVYDLDASGRITLLVDVRMRLPKGKTESQVSHDEIEVERDFVERWLEELVLLPLESGFHLLSESELDELDASPANGRGDSFPKRGGVESTDDADQATLVRQASRGAERLRELMAKVAKPRNGA